jgi:hypothetical protein
MGQDMAKMSIFGKDPAKTFGCAPGPGHYKSVDFSGRAALWSKLSEKRLPNAPGPDGAPVGSYSPDRLKILNKNPSYTMRVPPKDFPQQMLSNPGPGSYDKKAYSISAPGLSRGPRFIRKDNGIPGPGAYKLLAQVADVPKYALPGRKDEERFV